MLVFPTAKINLGLNIVAKRSDGYHNIESIFYPIGISDALELVLSKNNQTQLHCSGQEIPGITEDNLILKAWKIMADAYQLPPVDIYLIKRIPMGGGIGGGSADTGFFINLVNDFFELKLSIKEREQIATQLGSDCPFFIKNEACYVSGRGEILSPISSFLKGKHLVLCYGNVHISTQEAYQGIVAKAANFDLRQVPNTPQEEWKNLIKNDFETSVFKKFPALKALKNECYKQGAFYASMTGTGSCIYGLFDEAPTNSELINKHLVWSGLL